MSRNRTEKVRVVLELPKAELDWLQKLAKMVGTPLSKEVERAIDHYCHLWFAPSR